LAESVELLTQGFVAMDEKSTWVGGQWNAYVESGSTKDVRKARLAEVPADMRKDVELHVKTVFSLRAWHARQAAEKAKKGKS